MVVCGWEGLGDDHWIILTAITLLLFGQIVSVNSINYLLILFYLFWWLSGPHTIETIFNIENVCHFKYGQCAETGIDLKWKSHLVWSSVRCGSLFVHLHAFVASDSTGIHWIKIHLIELKSRNWCANMKRVSSFERFCWNPLHTPLHMCCNMIIMTDTVWRMSRPSFCCVPFSSWAFASKIHASFNQIWCCTKWDIKWKFTKYICGIFE